ncbi:copper amine oxidase [Pedobacter ureilyticus]|uniref:Copper amine oxidase n=1 Tax=Pedobacter ureilyticus TaxID=1393051 RepID=A0ABW9J7P7_9SPHI|nr:copper amine oxidase [Pedobacter helvus]
MMKLNKTAFLLAGVSIFGINTYAQQLTKAQNQELLKAGQGAIVKLEGFLTEKTAQIPFQKYPTPGPQYIISDDPEYIRVPEAIALKESVVPGAVRFYLYNVNGVKEPKQIDCKIIAMIKNTGKAPMRIKMLKYVSQAPSTNYFKLGKEGLASFLAAQPSEEVRIVKPGDAVPIDEKLEQYVVKYDELVHGFYEFLVDQPAEITVLQTDLKTSGKDALKRITNVLPPKTKSGAGRGLYGVSNYHINNTTVIDTKNGTSSLVIADGVNDPWIIGREGTTGHQAKLAGNYGVIYDVELKWKSTDGKGLALITWNSRSADNQWCSGMAAAMKVSEGKFKEGIIQLPKDQLVTKAAPEAVLIQVFKPAANGEEQTIKLTYSPPGASCLPTPLILVPVDLNP